MRVAGLAAVLCVVTGAVRALGAAGSRKDDDFTFSDAGLQELRHDAAAEARPELQHARGASCASVSCRAREVCVVRGGSARCVRRARGRGARCVGCARAGPGAGEVCGSDGRTYASLCRLDLHNCVRGAGAVTLRCGGACPCADCDQLVPRLLAWFRVLRLGAGGAGGAGGADDARWMFARLDSDGDGRLSRRETRALRQDRRERCVPGLLAGCARGAGGSIRRRDWRDCLRVRDELSDDEDAADGAGSGDHNLLD